MKRTQRAWRDFAVRIRNNAGAIATAAAMIGGWLLVTAGIATRLPPRPVWFVSLGLLCCSLGGWQLIYTIARYGLYALHHDDED